MQKPLVIDFIPHACLEVRRVSQREPLELPVVRPVLRHRGLDGGRGGEERSEARGVVGLGEELGEPEGRVGGGEVADAQVDEEGGDDVVGEDGEVVGARDRHGGWVGVFEAEGDGVEGEHSFLEAVDRCTGRGYVRRRACLRWMFGRTYAVLGRTPYLGKQGYRGQAA